MFSEWVPEYVLVPISVYGFNCFRQENIRMGKKRWLMCPVCNGKRRTMIYEETTLKYFPLYCPKCKLEKIVDVEWGKIVKVKDYIPLG